jgi:hypothetical protein
MLPLEQPGKPFEHDTAIATAGTAPLAVQCTTRRAHRGVELFEGCTVYGRETGLARRVFHLQRATLADDPAAPDQQRMRAAEKGERGGTRCRQRLNAA